MSIQMHTHTHTYIHPCTHTDLDTRTQTHALNMLIVQRGVKSRFWIFISKIYNFEGIFMKKTTIFPLLSTHPLPPSHTLTHLFEPPTITILRVHTRRLKLKLTDLQKMLLFSYSF